MPAKEVLSLGYPDIVATQQDVARILGIVVLKTTDFGAWHGVKHPLPETMELFEKLGSKLTCIDIHASRGVERIIDLNIPTEIGLYDLVIDGGTIEHCFHIGTSLMNAAGAVKPGGRIFHGTPMSMVNHGFYNVSPTLFHDFYTQNGWEIERFYAVDRRGDTYDVPTTGRVQIGPEISLCCLAQRKDDRPLIVPTQTKYLKNPDLH